MGRFLRAQPAIPASIKLRPRWRGWLFPLVAITLGISGVVCVRTRGTPTTTSSQDLARYHDRTFRVSRVVDGDTFDIEARDGDKPVTRIRLWGVDTPEVARDSTPGMHFGAEASAFAKRKLADQQVHIVLSPERSRGKYGRLLAYAFMKRGGAMFNEMLLEEGYAYADLRFRHHYYDRFKTIERQARKAGHGLWAEITLEKMPAWKQRFETRGR